MVDDGQACGCRVEEVFQLLSRAHMLDILHIFTRQAEGPQRFKDIEAALEVSPNTLTNRLKELVEAGLVDRQAYKEIPPRVEYQATEKAMDLREIFDSIHDWADRHDLQAATAPS